MSTFSAVIGPRQSILTGREKGDNLQVIDSIHPLSFQYTIHQNHNKFPLNNWMSMSTPSSPEEKIKIDTK